MLRNTIFQTCISAIDDIFWLIQTSQEQYFGFQVHFKLIRVYDLKIKSDFRLKNDIII